MTIRLPKPTTIVLDIEGTTSSTWFVHETLYPYSRDRFGQWLEEKADHPDVQRARGQIIDEAGLAPDSTVDELVGALQSWLANDEKKTPLKTLQGLIWAEGFTSGDLTSHFFEDSIPAIRRWAAEGIDLKIFSSGSVNAQTSWFGNSPEGSLLDMFTGHFDTENAGPKKLASSYATIREVIGVPADEILFFSDLVEELDAAREDGWHTVGVRREGDQYYDRGVGDHPEINNFNQVEWT